MIIHAYILDTFWQTDLRSCHDDPYKFSVLRLLDNSHIKGRTLVNHEQDQRLMMNPPASRAKIVKRYQNRKLYDTQQSCYVTLDDIAKMIRADEQVIVIDNKTKNDITYMTQLQLLADQERKSLKPGDTELLKRVIRAEEGTLTGYIRGLEAQLNLDFPTSIVEKPATTEVKEETSIPAFMSNNVSINNVETNTTTLN